MAEVPLDDGLNAWRSQELLWTLRWLAAEPDATLEAVSDICIADEIALDVDHWYELATQWGLLDRESAALIGAIDEEFRAMTERDDPTLWTDEAIRSSAIWASQRTRARAALASMSAERADSELGSPREGGPVYVTSIDWPRSIRSRLRALKERLVK